MRIPWPADFPPVLAHTPWRQPVAGALANHTAFWPAKTKGDAQAALRLCDDLVREPVLQQLRDLCLSDDVPPVVVAPSLASQDSHNALANGFARWLANEMGWDADRDVFQTKGASRDFIPSGWFRLANQPAFYGTVKAGRKYVIADDVCTLGGTMACLRGFIERNGGRVVCMTAIASDDGNPVKISVADQTLARLLEIHGRQLDDVCRERIGFPLDCLTEPEANILRLATSIDAIRVGLDGAGSGELHMELDRLLAVRQPLYRLGRARVTRASAC